jgi:hypothetical protein
LGTRVRVKAAAQTVEAISEEGRTKVVPINFKGVPVRDDTRGDPGDSWTLIDPVKDIYEWTPASGGGGGGTYVHDQPVASVTWVINHGLLYYPSVSVVDSTGRVIVPDDISYATINQVIVSLTPAVAGKAYLS